MSRFALPQISISPPPKEEPVAEPFSPFSSLSLSPVSPPDEDGFRPVLLTPPPDLTRFHRKSSPLRPREPVPVNGLERARFEELLQASRERNAIAVAKKNSDLRKEITLKAHKTKHDERRARFLSKVHAPPSPTATLTPVTPPDSPAIFHFSLPSPGLASPLSIFETMSPEEDGYTSFGREPWIEEIDFRRELGVPQKAKEPVTRARPLPSLDQISARLGTQGAVRPQSPVVPGRRTRLPAFLSPVKEQAQQAVKTPFNPVISKPVINSISSNTNGTRPVRKLPPVPVSQVQVNVSLESLDLQSRERRAHDMMSTLRRRTVLSGADEDSRKAKWKRQSAPADLIARERSGFEHPTLRLPGGF